jgi:cysteinyl-tRNA synthetase
MLIDKREKLRKENKFKEADELRKEIEKKGYKVEDLPKGSKVRKTRPENKNIRN